MAPPSPRRSSRARLSNSQSQQSSSASSISSGRIDRNTRSNNKTPSDKSTPSASVASEPPEELHDPHILRRRRRVNDDERDKILGQESAGMANGSDDIQEDDEAVRCICGFDDYPGPPPVDNESRPANDATDSIIFSSVDISDDISGFYVQCDICKVWQHGACVGITTEESSPDEYFCEQCRKDLHRIHNAANGQRYSAYLPLSRPPRSSRSVSVTKEGTRSPKSGMTKAERASSAAQTAKRRSTMNSREAAYDEEEQLRRAIEASKELLGGPDEIITRRTKRVRSDSEENPASVKRQRTSSRSASPPSDTKTEPQGDSDEGATTRNGSKKARSSRSQKEKTDMEERERQRLEAANTRKGRADRRRVESQAAPSVPEKESSAQLEADSDPSDEVPLAAVRATSAGIKPADIQPTVEPLPPPVLPAPAPDTPPPGNPPPNSAHKKSARTHKKTKGRNQYTRDRDDSERSPARSLSRETPRNDETNGGGHARMERHHTKSSRAGPHSKVSMNELKRRSAAFLDFIAKTQVELASEDLAEDRLDTSPPTRASSNGAPAPRVNGGSDSGTKTAGGQRARSPSSVAPSFKELNCVEMMDFLATDLVKWQNRYTA